VLSMLYQEYGNLPEGKRFFTGFVPAVIAVIVSVAWRMAKQNVKGIAEGIIAAISIISLIFIPKQYRLYLTFGLVISSGLFGYFFYRDKKQAAAVSAPKGKFPIGKTILAAAMVVLLIVGLYLPVDASEYKSIYNLVKTFSGLSVMLFGGGYVIIPIM